MRLKQIKKEKPKKQGGWFLINSLHKPLEAVTDRNFTEMSAFYASPRPGDGYLGFVDSKGEVTHHLKTYPGNQIGTVPGKPW